MDAVEALPAKGPLANSARMLAEMLAETDAFRERVDASVRDEALMRIWGPHRQFGLDEEPTGAFAVVWAKGPIRWGQENGPPLRLRSATLTLCLHDEDRYPADPERSAIDFSNFIDEVVADMAASDGRNGSPIIRSVEIPEGGLLPPSLRAAGEGRGQWTVFLDIVMGAGG